MKKLGRFILVLLFALFVFKPIAFAQYNIEVPTQSITPSPSPAPQTRYYLPYPGLLPGNPLYTLKAARDKLIEFFVSDPAKKTNFYLLQADKRLAASLGLFSLGKNVLAEQTLSKSQNYLEKAIKEVPVAQNSNENVSDYVAKIQGSSKKQIEEINALILKEKGDTLKRLKGDLKRAQNLEKLAEQLNH